MDDPMHTESGNSCRSMMTMMIIGEQGKKRLMTIQLHSMHGVEGSDDVCLFVFTLRWLLIHFNLRLVLLFVACKAYLSQKRSHRMVVLAMRNERRDCYSASRSLSGVFLC